MQIVNQNSQSSSSSSCMVFNLDVRGAAARTRLPAEAESAARVPPGASPWFFGNPSAVGAGTGEVVETILGETSEPSDGGWKSVRADLGRISSAPLMELPAKTRLV
jgi:hypothetical protein